MQPRLVMRLPRTSAVAYSNKPKSEKRRIAKLIDDDICGIIVFREIDLKFVDFYSRLFNKRHIYKITKTKQQFCEITVSRRAYWFVKKLSRRKHRAFMQYVKANVVSLIRAKLDSTRTVYYDKKDFEIKGIPIERIPIDK